MSLIYAIVPARSGSKGIRDKNIQKIAGKELLAYSIEFAKKLKPDRIFCSTDSSEYAAVAKCYGAEVPFLRASFAALDTSMEEDILKDLYDKFDQYQIEYPDIFVWLRPTFLFRDREATCRCIEMLISDSELTSVRLIIEAESRLYKIEGGRLIPDFDDHGKSMVRRQSVEKRYRVYNTDIFRGKPKNDNDKFLGENIGYVITDRVCGLDIDDEIDMAIAALLIEHKRGLVEKYL